MEEIQSVEDTQIKERKCILLKTREHRQLILQCDVSVPQHLPPLPLAPSTAPGLLDVSAPPPPPSGCLLPRAAPSMSWAPLVNNASFL